MQLVQAVDKSVTKPVVKIFIGIILLGFILYAIIWAPSLFDNYESLPKQTQVKAVPLEELSEENIQQETFAQRNYEGPPAGVDETNSFSQEQQMTEPATKQEFKVVQEKNQETKEVDNSTNGSTAGAPPIDFKETVTWGIGIIQSFLLVLLAIKKLFGKGA